MTQETAALAGRRVIITRSREQGETLSRRLSEAGAHCLHIPLIEQVPLPESDAARRAADAALARVATYDWLILTSPNAVRFTLERLSALGVGPDALAHVAIAVVGPGTEAALRAFGLQAHLQPRRYRWQELAAAVAAAAAPGQRVLLPRSEQALPALPEALRRHGLQVDDVTLYRTQADPAQQAALRHVLTTEAIDAVVLFSGSAVKAYREALAALSEAERAAVRPPVLAVIGPNTAEEAAQLGLAVDVVPPEATIEATVAALARYFAERGGSNGTAHS